MQTLDDVLKMAVENGYRAFKRERTDDSKQFNGAHYGYIITPDGNILYIQDQQLEFRWAGFHISFQYKPSREWGSGVALFDCGTDETIDADLLASLERRGLCYTHHHKIRNWESFDAWFEHYWDAKNLKEVTV